MRALAAVATGLMLLGASVAIAGQEPHAPEIDTPVEAAAPRSDTRTQYPAFLINSYFGVDAGYLDYGFTERLLEPGFHVERITVPHAAARVTLFGHEFNQNVSAQLTYMRPVQYVTYTNVNGDGSAHHVWANFGGLTMRARVPIARRTRLYGEGGLGITSRHGFPVGAVHPTVRDAHYASFLAGGGVERSVTPAWDLTAGALYSPGDARVAEPRALMISGGFRYTMRALSDDVVDANRLAAFSFPLNLLRVEYSTGYGYAINTFLSDRVPVFWGGNVHVDRGVAVHYDRGVFHTEKIFALELGASVSSWRSQADRNEFFTLSAYPLFRFTWLRTRAADAYFCYSLAGPTYISRVTVDGLDTGHHFTFQDFMGAGVFLGRHRSVEAGVKINHYSNGNIFTENAGLKIPVTLVIGYSFPRFQG